MSSTIYLRREVNGLPAGGQTLSAYAAAVATMQQRSATDPTSWSFQAAIHGTHASNPRPSQNQCQHATWYFVSWHRAFLYYFERIVRAAVIEAGGPDDWALPYWNYELGGSGAAIPAAFRSAQSGGRSNPLYVAQRRPGINAGYALRPQATTSQKALACATFVGALEFGGGPTGPMFQQFNGPTGQLEASPHNTVHGAVGGQTGWMNDPDQAAQDPIFWLHHSNIDRLWMLWVHNGHTNPTHPQWLNQSFSFFDEHGQQVSMTAAQVLDPVADLSYTYDQFVSSPKPPTPPSPGGSAPGPVAMRMSAALRREPELVGAAASPVELTGERVAVEVEFDQRAVRSALAAPSTGLPRVLLEIQNIVAEQHPGSVYGVYVDLPATASVENADAFHVGNLSFFGVERALEPRGDEQAHGMSYVYDATKVVNSERQTGHWSDQLVTVTFIPLDLLAPEGQDPVGPGEGPEPPVTLGSISVYYA